MSFTSSSLVLATGNQGKIRELRDLFAGLPLELKSLRDFEQIVEVEETGSSFRENAELKASGFAVQTMQLALADDSGLEVEALGNAPGIYSARFAGSDTGYDVKIKQLLAMLDEAGHQTRSARFVCAMALADGQGKIIHTVEGVCTGTIAAAPNGENGFGYDPIFIPGGFDRTFGELGDDVKRQISHRGKAAELIIRYLLDFIVL
jgi:XTP/dITP diphosphohydrolase